MQHLFSLAVLGYHPNEPSFKKKSVQEIYLIKTTPQKSHTNKAF